MWHSAVKDIPSMVENERLHRTPQFFSSSKKRSSTAKKRKMVEMQEDPDWCWVREQQ